MKKDIFLSDENLNKAGKTLDEISADAAAMKEEIDALLQQLSAGFDTPAGRKLVSSTEELLLGPMNDMALLLSHIAQTLRSAKNAYAPVFDEYRRLNSRIRV